MQKLLIGLALVAAVASVSAQDRDHNARQHYTSHTTRTTTRSTNGGRRYTSHTTTTNAHYGGHRYASGNTNYRTTGRRYAGAVRNGTYRNAGRYNSFGHHYSSSALHNARFRPGGTGHSMGWFQARGGWNHGPAYIRPSFSCYVGYAWGSMPTEAVTCWILDSLTGQYYEAYYYPQYGYYAWYNNPLVAVGVYSPAESIVIIH